MIKWYNFDMMLTFDRSYRSEKIEREALMVPGIAQTDVWLQLPVRRVRPDGSESAMLYMFAPHVDESALIRSPAISEGRWLTPEDDNAVLVPSTLFRDEPDLGIGKEIVLKIYGKEESFKIVGTFLGTPFAPVIYVNYDYLSKIANRVGETDALLVRTQRHDADSVKGESEALEKHFEEMGLQVSTVNTLPDEKAEAEATFDVLVVLLLVMAVLLALVGGLGLMGTMSINVLERTREIGVLRAIGASNRSVVQVFILEGIAIGLLSWILGSLLAIPMSQGLNQAVGGAIMGTPLSYSYSIFGFWLWLFVVLLLSALASFIPARNASRLTVREVLAYE
jgi:putative ABC transport system permease protein